MATYSKSGKKKKVAEPAVQKIRKSREEDKATPCYLSNDGFLWTDNNPDLKLIEPRILVSTNYNYLEFSRKADRPPERRVLTLINHGDHPVAFEVQTTDNYSYFIDVVHGIIPPRQTSVNAAIRMPNSVCIQVYHRPYNAYSAERQSDFFNRPRKDKMSILLAPQICQTFSPEAIFHNERSYEKLRIMLKYTGIEEKSGDGRPKQFILHGVPGSATWKDDSGIRKTKNEQQMLEFKKIEKTIIQNASKEVCEEMSKKPIIRRPSPLRARSKTPGSKDNKNQRDKREGGVMKMFRNLNPFDRTPTPTTKKTQSVTPSNSTPSPAKPATPTKTPTPTKKPVENNETLSQVKTVSKALSHSPKSPKKNSQEKSAPPSPKLPPKTTAPTPTKDGGNHSPKTTNKALEPPPSPNRTHSPSAYQPAMSPKPTGK